ncbi:DNA/RNA helicase domain-containing protein [Bordetella sp. 02P26C-1]|uniref:DNA/RNA helicase domain-containing protein n=1 Tax=Bordetella sp. 02P26C-1 TaxID=2683195 RepID=UPI0013552B81|nr:DNA/RNA helicase domain-containing protein [Bordetella sp. 02P26C-1]MVW78087.1 DUF2075 domain-containing protein [Bordetella sp. 02P26C-1]
MAALATLTIKDFCKRATNQDFVDLLVQRFGEVFDQGSVSPQEMASWKKSLPALARLLEPLSIDGHILIEYPMPLGTRRADCLLVGDDAAGQTHIIVIELKQWSQGSVTLNETFDMGWLTVDAHEPYCADHPCEQANVYSTALEQLLDYGDLAPKIHAVAYLHEYREIENDLLRRPQFQDHLRHALLVTRDIGREEVVQLLAKLQMPSERLNRLTAPKLRYSSSFIANFSDKLNCSALFDPSPEQIEIFKDIVETLDAVEGPTCVIINGIVGTGKTVLAMLLIRHLMERGKNPRYHVRSAAIKACVEQLDFYSDGTAETEYLVVDEAHRLAKERLKRLLRNKRLAVFFIDDNQWLHPDETCRSHHIQDEAARAGMHILERTLVKQLRCEDAGKYLQWVDGFLNHGELETLESNERYEVLLADSPEEMVQFLKNRAQGNTTCRVVGGYCWPWNTFRTPGRGYDIEIGDWKARWNANGAYAEWNRGFGLIAEVGAIYTVQGFEYDYVGVLIGEDLAFVDGKGLRVRPAAQQYKQLTETLNRLNLPEEQKRHEFARAVRNIYYVLMTRAKKGVVLYAADSGLRNALRRYIRSDPAQGCAPLLSESRRGII